MPSLVEMSHGARNLEKNDEVGGQPLFSVNSFEVCFIYWELFRKIMSRIVVSLMNLLGYEL